MLMDLHLTAPAARVRILQTLATKTVHRWLAAGALPHEVSNCLTARVKYVDDLWKDPDRIKAAVAAGKEYHRHELDCEELLRALVRRRKVIDPQVPQLWQLEVDQELLDAIRTVLREKG